MSARRRTAPAGVAVTASSAMPRRSQRHTIKRRKKTHDLTQYSTPDNTTLQSIPDKVGDVESRNAHLKQATLGQSTITERWEQPPSPPAQSLPGISSDQYLVHVGKALQEYWNGIHEKKLVLQRPNPPHLSKGYPPQLTRNIPANVSVQDQETRHMHSPLENQMTTLEEILGVAEAVSMYNHKLQHAVALVPKTMKLKLTTFKTNLAKFTEVIDKIRSFYSAEAMGFLIDNCPTLDDLSFVERTVPTLLGYLQSEELTPLLQQYINDQCTYTYDHILYAILGLQEDLGDWLFKLDDDIKMHQDITEHIRNFIENEENTIKAKNIFKETGKKGLKNKLGRIGFTSYTAEMVTASIPDDLVDLHLPSFWAMRYLEFAFHYHPLLSDVPIYPYNKDVQDRWFEKRIPVDKRPEPPESEVSGKRRWPVKMMNITSSRGRGYTLAEEFIREQENDTEYKLMYHGTTHQSAVDIVHKGISLTEGHKGLDFSSGDGFYLSENFENAKRWMRAGRGERHQAVIVFKVKQDLLDPVSHRGLDLTNDRTRWEQVIRLCRNRYDNLVLKRDLLRDKKFIRGPMCRNPRDARSGGPVQGFRDRSNMQFCVRDEDYAWELGSLANICCVLFYR